VYLRNRKWRIGCWAIACQLTLLVVILPLQAEIIQVPETITKEQKGISDVEESGGTVGKAYYYNKHYNKRKTRSGAIYNPQKLTAAHPTIPFGTRVKVVNLANNRSVVVTVNDRCRKRNFEFIDLSRAAARKLGFLGKGMARVRIIEISE
jgi:rare lipoprotein A